VRQGPGAGNISGRGARSRRGFSCGRFSRPRRKKRIAGHGARSRPFAHLISLSRGELGLLFGLGPWPPPHEGRPHRFFFAFRSGQRRVTSRFSRPGAPRPGRRAPRGGVERMGRRPRRYVWMLHARRSDPWARISHLQRPAQGGGCPPDGFVRPGWNRGSPSEAWPPGAGGRALPASRQFRRLRRAEYEENSPGHGCRFTGRPNPKLSGPNNAQTALDFAANNEIPGKTPPHEPGRFGPSLSRTRGAVTWCFQRRHR